MSELPVWGIDLTAVSLRAIKLALAENGGVRAEAWEVIDFAEDVEDVHALGRFDAFGRAVHSFLRHHDVSECRTFVSVRGEPAFARTVTVPQVNNDNLDKLLEYEAQQHIPYPIEDVYWDRRVISIREGGDLVATIYAIKKTLIDDRIHKLQFAGMPVDGVQLRPIALHNFCSRERLIEADTIVVDVDYGGTQVLFLHEDQSWFQCLPIGAFELVSRLRSRLKLDHVAAVRLATGITKPRGQQTVVLEDLRREVAHEIASEVRQVTRNYLGLRPGVKLSNAVVFETHAATPPMAEVLKAELGISFFRPKGFHNLEIDPEIVSAGIQENFAGLARAAGLALQGMGKADVAIRLYPETIPRSFKPRRAGYLVAAAAVLAMVGISYQQHRVLRQDITETTQQMKAYDEQLFRKTRSTLEQELQPDPLLSVAARWAARSKGREGHLPWFDSLLRRLQTPDGKPRDESTAPLLVAFEAGDVEGRVPQKNTGRLVLAHVENASTADLDRELDSFVAAMVGAEGLKSAVPTEGWSCGAVTARAPSPPDERTLRFRFRHRSYDLTWEMP